MGVRRLNVLDIFALNSHLSNTLVQNFKKWHGVVHETLLHIKHLAEISLLSLQRLISVLWDLLGMAEMLVL
jgi:hypothetical protein